MSVRCAKEESSPASPRHGATQAVQRQDGAEHDRCQRQHERTGVTDVEKFESDSEAIDIQRVRRIAWSALRRNVDDVEETQEIDTAQDRRGHDRRHEQRQRDATEYSKRGGAVDLRCFVDARRQRLEPTEYD